MPSFQDCINSVTREKKYLLSTEERPLEKVERFVLRMIEQKNPQFVALRVAKTGPQVVGWCDIARWDQPVTRHAGNLGMGVKAGFRGQGIGRRLLKATLECAWSLDFDIVRLNVYTSNLAAVKLYRQFGFVEEGVIKDFARLGDRCEDAYQMACFRPKDAR